MTPVRGPLCHVDLSVVDPDRSIPFYDALFRALGYRRLRSDHRDFEGERPRRAGWLLPYPGSRAVFGVEVRPAGAESSQKRHDRYAPGLHHLAFHAESRTAVDDVFERMRDAGATVLDPPTDYSGREGYGADYYAVFFEDPDGVKLEVVHEALTNPE